MLESWDRLNKLVKEQGCLSRTASVRALSLHNWLWAWRGLSQGENR